MANSIQNVQEVKNFILEKAATGAIGCGTMRLYENFSVRNINAAIRQLINERKISISCPQAGFRLKDSEGWNKKGIEISLRAKNFDVKLEL